MNTRELRSQFNQIIAEMPHIPNMQELSKITGIGSHTLRKFCTDDDFVLPWRLQIKLLKWINFHGRKKITSQTDI